MEPIKFQAGDYLFCHHTRLLCQYIGLFENKPFLTKPERSLGKCQVRDKDGDIPEKAFTGMYTHDFIKKEFFAPPAQKMKIIRVNDLTKFYSDENIEKVDLNDPKKTSKYLIKGVIFDNIICTHPRGTWKNFLTLYEGDIIQFSSRHYGQGGKNLANFLVDSLYIIYQTNHDYGPTGTS